MATQFCQKCKQSHPGRTCDYDDKGECAETLDVEENAKPCLSSTDHWLATKFLCWFDPLLSTH